MYYTYLVTSIICQQFYVTVYLHSRDTYKSTWKTDRSVNREKIVDNQLRITSESNILSLSIYLLGIKIFR